jgi:hypothetical protein
LSSAALQDQIQMVALRPGPLNWILRYNTAVVFDVHVQVSAWNHAISQPQNLRKSVCSKPMLGVVADMRLQHNPFLFAGDSATIDEVPDYMANFSDVRMFRNIITIGENKPGRAFRIRFKRNL